MKHFMRLELKEYFSFTTAMVSKLSGGPDKVPLKTIVGIDIKLFENSTAKAGTISSDLFECCEFLTFVNGSYDAGDLNKMKSPEGFVKPTAFVFESWQPLDEEKFKWKRVSRTTVNGVEWLCAFHTGDGGDRMCAGIANFSYKNAEIVSDTEGHEVTLPCHFKHPEFRLKDFIKGIT